MTPKSALGAHDSDEPFSVHLHILTAGDAGVPRTVRLEHHSSGAGDWITVCAAPCDKELPAEGAYRVTGDDMAPSAAFELDRTKRDLFVVVHPTSPGHAIGGFVTMALGGLFALIGAALVATAAPPQTDYDNGAADIGPAVGEATQKLLGASLILGGAIATVVGLTLVVLSLPRKSAVEVRPFDAASARLRFAGAPGPFEWASPPLHGRTPPAVGFPVLTIRF